MQDSQIASEPASATPTPPASSTAALYELDAATRDLLIESAPLLAKWSKTECKAKPQGGMEQWAKGALSVTESRPASCAWYHGTWQYMRLLNMAAVPPWYKFYSRALGSFLRRKPQARIFISGCADYGMLATLHQAITASGAAPAITVVDICTTPLLACQWYANRYGIKIDTICDNIITSKTLALGQYDLVVTDEFLTVLPGPDKSAAVERWKELLRPGGTVITTAMIGGVTTPDLRKRYAENGIRLAKDKLAGLGAKEADIEGSIEQFARFHTRHMIANEKEIRDLFSGFYLGFVVPTLTPGECVNPTTSIQIVATLPHLRPAAG